MKNAILYLIWRPLGFILSYWRFALRFALFLGHLFAVPLLLKTLFSPWKRDITVAGKNGFDPKEWFNRHLFNFFSRFIGLFAKTCAIAFWLLLEIIWLSGSTLLFFPLYLAPLLAPIFIILAAMAFTGWEVVFVSWSNGSVGGVLLLIVGLVLAFFELKVLRGFFLMHKINPDPGNPGINDSWFINLCNHFLIEPNELKAVWLKDEMKKVLLSAHITRQEFDKLLEYSVGRQIFAFKNRAWWLPENLWRIRPITEDWVFGWTFNLNKFSAPVRKTHTLYLANNHPKELEIVKSNLAESKGINLVLTAENGTGRRRLVENLAIDLETRNIPASLLGKKIVELQLENVIASAKTEEEKIYLLEKIFLETVSSGNIILFIPELKNYLSSGEENEGLGKTDISAILMNFLANADIQILTMATPDEIHQIMKNRFELNKFFKLIKLEEPALEDCLPVVFEKTEELEARFGVLITFGAQRRTLEIADRYLSGQSMPQRALDFLEETISFHHEHHADDHIVKENDVESFASNKLGVTVGAPINEEKEKLAGLEEELNRKIIDQKEAVSVLVSALLRRRMDVSNPNRPAGCFLFLGPTGTGKTHTAETLSEVYFKGEDRMARLDMSEYQGAEALKKLLGDSEGEVEGFFHKILTANPFNLILLDELEKADSSVHKLLLQIMEEGMARTGRGKKLNFRETIVIATSNAAALLIQEMVKKGSGAEEIKKAVLDKIQQDGIFSPEMLNRFDGIVVFEPLNLGGMTKVAGLSLNKLKKRLEMKEILIDFDNAFLQKLAEKGFDPVFGARELRRVVEKDIEEKIARDILAGKVEKGRTFNLPLEYLE